MLISLQDLIKRSYELYAKNAKLFFTYAVIISLPSIALSYLIIALQSVFNLQQLTFLTTLYTILFIILGVVSYFLTLWFSIAFIKVIFDKYNDKNVANIKIVINNTKKLIIPTFIVSVLTGLAILAGFILLIIPGIILSVWFAFSLYIVILEEKKSTEAMKESKKIVAGRWFPTFIRLLVPSLLFLLVNGILLFPFNYIMANSKSILISNLVDILSSVVNIALAPLLIASQTILYNELKKTKKI